MKAELIRLAHAYAEGGRSLDALRAFLVDVLWEHAPAVVDDETRDLALALQLAVAEYDLGHRNKNELIAALVDLVGTPVVLINALDPAANRSGSLAEIVEGRVAFA